MVAESKFPGEPVAGRQSIKYLVMVNKQKTTGSLLDKKDTLNRDKLY
jgi:hypothetical protein